MIFGQKPFHQDKINELTAFKELINFLNIDGKTITADALHYQKSTCKEIINKSGDYVFGLKENQKVLYNSVKSLINGANIDVSETNEINGCRKERRICSSITDLSSLKNRDEWVGLKSVFSVRRIVECNGKTSDETSYYISSLTVCSGDLLKIVREHWKIESLHWLLDVVFSEDKCSIISENGHKSLNILRKLALFLHKQYIAKQTKKRSIKSSMLSALINEKHLCNIIESL